MIVRGLYRRSFGALPKLNNRTSDRKLFANALESVNGRKLRVFLVYESFNILKFSWVFNFYSTCSLQKYDIKIDNNEGFINGIKRSTLIYKTSSKYPKNINYKNNN